MLLKKSIPISSITREQATDKGNKRHINTAPAWIKEPFVEEKLQYHSNGRQQITLRISDKPAVS